MTIELGGYCTTIAIGLTALLWDHLLTFSDEIDVIWCKPCTLSKFTFVFLRYGVLAALLLIAYGTSSFIIIIQGS